MATQMRNTKEKENKPSNNSSLVFTDQLTVNLSDKLFWARNFLFVQGFRAVSSMPKLGIPAAENCGNHSHVKIDPICNFMFTHNLKFSGQMYLYISCFPFNSFQKQNSLTRHYGQKSDIYSKRNLHAQEGRGKSSCPAQVNQLQNHQRQVTSFLFVNGITSWPIQELVPLKGGW